MSTTELLDLLRRLPPHQIETNLGALVDVLGGPSNEVADELLSSVDQPLKILRDASGREFLACDFNRDSLPEDELDDDAGAASGDAYR
jgi:capping protein beta